MAHTAETIRRVVRYLSVIIEVVDARAPLLTRYERMRTWMGTCPVVLVLNKADLADPAATHAWTRYFDARGEVAVPLTATRPEEAARLLRRLETAARPTTVRRAAVVGLPNLGKSTLLNHLLGRAHLRTANRPGVTRGPQWVRRGRWEWLDLPGVLARAQERDWRLKVLGAVGFDPSEAEDLALRLLQALGGTPPDPTQSSPVTGGEAASGGDDPLDRFGHMRGIIGRGGGVDRQRAAEAVIAAFQQGRLGRLTLEWPPGE
ncbi:MAG: 50S ribosome-binding GTPase [Actinomycetia bacterium]|nr:50S ribosome-binding GTPase [Actinomycetes bacterium]